MSTMEIRYSTMASPIGRLAVARTSAGLSHVRFLEGPRAQQIEADWRRDDKALADALQALDDYFSGKLRSFTLPLDPRGTPFQRQVWDALCAVPLGMTLSYADLAERIGSPSAVRAVASANARNPIPIVIPCHRIIGSDGKLRGYAGGLEIKAALLDHEFNISARLAAAPV